MFDGIVFNRQISMVRVFVCSISVAISCSVVVSGTWVRNRRELFSINVVDLPRMFATRVASDASIYVDLEKGQPQKIRIFCLRCNSRAVAKGGFGKSA